MIKIERLHIEDSHTIIDWVQKLLVELGEEGEEAGELNIQEILSFWREFEDKIVVFVARSDSNDIIGITTVVESFAIYANGAYGIINEMYVAPEWRSSGVGGQLIEAVKGLGKEKRWSRIDVTAPESERWQRTRDFYETQGFVYTGPKLKYLIAR